MNARKTIAVAALCMGAGSSFGQQNPMMAPPQNVVQLSATAALDVRQDLLTLTLAATREGPEPGAVQTELKQALDAALASVKQDAAPPAMEVRTGNFSLYPRYSKEGRISTWQGRAELVLEGRDFVRIAAAAGRVQGLTVSGASFSLSREQRGKAEAEAQTAAIENYKTQADRIAKSFGFGGYALREVSIHSNDQYPPPRPRMMAMEAKVASSAADAPVPVEAGNSTVLVTVSGTVQLK